MNIGEELSKYFEEIGVSQAKIAQELGVTKAYVNALFAGRSRFGKKQAEKWSEHFGLSKSWLLTGEGPMLRDGGAEETRNTAEQGAAIAIGGNATGHYSVTTSPMSDEERQELVKLRAENAGLRAQLEEKERTIQILLNARR